MMTTLRETQLENGIKLVFTDESNRYFGDYHRVCVVATLICKLSLLPCVNSDDAVFKQKALDSLGKELTVVKRFERMGVASADVETVRTSLIETFLQHSSPYLSRAGYARSLVNAELNKPRKHSFYG